MQKEKITGEGKNSKGNPAWKGKVVKGKFTGREKVLKGILLVKRRTLKYVKYTEDFIREPTWWKVKECFSLQGRKQYFGKVVNIYVELYGVGKDNTAETEMSQEPLPLF